MKTIVTHVNPDFDATTYVWLMRKYAPGFEDAQINFMPFNDIDRPVLDAADSVGDMGGLYDPLHWRFDHHQFEGRAATGTCAAKMVWLQLMELGQDLYYLKPLMDEIHQGDLARTPLVGIHSLMRGWKAAAKAAGRLLSDYEVLDYGFFILKPIAFWLEKKAADKAELTECVAWKSEDNLVWAIRGGEVGTSYAAYDEGARVVVFQGKPTKLDGAHGAQVITYPVGANRAPEWQDPHLGELIRNIISGIDAPTYVRIKTELARWFCHNAGFFAGRGTGKAPDPEPLRVNLVEIAQAISIAWER